MKHFVRILIAVLIVGLIGFGVWFFAFRDKNHEAVFKEMTAAIDHLGEVSITYTYKQDTKDVSANVPGYDAILTEYETVSAEKDADKTEIVNIRTNIQTLRKYDDYSMEAIKYYYSLTATAEDVKNKDKRNMIEVIENFVKAVDNVVEVVDDSISFYYVKDANNTEQVKDILAKDVVLYKNMLAKVVAQTELYFELKEYVDKYVFDDVIPDYRSAFYNIYANELNIACNAVWDNPEDNSTTDLYRKDVDFYTYSNILTNVEIAGGNEESLIENLYRRKIHLEASNYIGDGAALFINSYNKLSSKIAKVLTLVKTDGSKNRLGFVQENAADLGALVIKDKLDEADTTKLNKISTQYKYEGVTSLAVSEILDIYNVLAYIRKG